MTGRAWQIVVAAVLGCAVLAGLGIWQIERLAWKNALIARIEERQSMPPVPVDDALRRAEAGEDIDYLPVSAAGRYSGGEFHMLTTYDGQPGWEVISPLMADSGVAILVDRGAVPDELRDPGRRAPAPQTAAVTGYAIWHRGGQGPFAPANDEAANLWYWWDVPAMLAAANIPAGPRVAPFVLHALPQTGDAGVPRPHSPTANLRNNHLQYALTWFGLCLVLAVIAGVLLRNELRGREA